MNALAVMFEYVRDHSSKATFIAAVEQDVESTFLLVDSKLARLLAGGERLDEHFHLVCGGKPHAGDPRFIDEFDYGTVVFWRCLAEESVEARARHVRSKLADIDRQVEHAPLPSAQSGGNQDELLQAARRTGDGA